MRAQIARHAPKDLLAIHTRGLDDQGHVPFVGHENASRDRSLPSPRGKNRIVRGIANSLNTSHRALVPLSAEEPTATDARSIWKERIRAVKELNFFTLFLIER